MTQRVQTWGHVLPGHTERCVKDRQGTRKTDSQIETEGGHINTHARAGVYIMTQRVQTWGHIFRGHIKTTHTNKYKIC